LLRAVELYFVKDTRARAIIIYEENMHID